MMDWLANRYASRYYKQIVEGKNKTNDSNRKTTIIDKDPFYPDNFKSQEIKRSVLFLKCWECNKRIKPLSSHIQVHISSKTPWGLIEWHKPYHCNCMMENLL